MRDAQTVEPYYSRAVWTPISSLPPSVHFLISWGALDSSSLGCFPISE